MLTYEVVAPSLANELRFQTAASEVHLTAEIQVLHFPTNAAPTILLLHVIVARGWYAASNGAITWQISAPLGGGGGGG